jgi:thiol-disulfide isomerase/thioredoxin
MTTLMRLLGVSILAIGLTAWAIPPTSTPTLKIGDRAPVLESISWLQGDPVTKYEPRRVYVVEFWATWCPPCTKAIPHLTAIQNGQILGEQVPAIPVATVHDSPAARI